METEQIKLMPTKAGKGFKIVVGEEWFYTSKRELYRMLGKKIPCIFRSIEEKPLIIMENGNAISQREDNIISMEVKE